MWLSRPGQPFHAPSRPRAEDGPEFEFFVQPTDAPTGSRPATTRTLVRSALADHLVAHGISREATVTLEYAPSVQPPVTGPDTPSKDWIAAVHACDG